MYVPDAEYGRDKGQKKEKKKKQQTRVMIRWLL
jgi:hypothetical protein